MEHQKQIYLDYNATTPLLNEVAEVMQPYWQDNFGNPASNQHSYGWKAEQAINQAKKTIAKSINCDPHEIYFTSGATESNNWAVWGLVQQLKIENKKAPEKIDQISNNTSTSTVASHRIHIISTNAEHKSVLEPIKNLSHWDIEYDLALVDSSGMVRPEQIKKLIKPHTKLISVMWANNELGTINPISEIGKLARENQIYFHTDATQSIGKIDCKFSELPIDLMTFSGHKLYGPKGVGALIVRKKNPSVTIAPIITGGGQQNNLRSGTLNVTGIVGLAKAVELLTQNREQNNLHLQKMRNMLYEYCKNNSNIIINTPLNNSISNTLNLTFENIDNMSFLNKTQELAVAASSACLSGSSHGSHVLEAIGRSEKQAKNSMRISLGLPNNTHDIEKIISIFDGLYK